MTAWSVCGRAQTADDIEARVKAAFLLNFARYTEWPAGAFASSNSPVVIGVLGQDTLGSNLDSTVQDKTVNGRAVIVRRARRVADLPNCHLIFIPATERERFRAWLGELDGKPVLTVSDGDGFTAAGGMVLLKRRQTTMRFDINRAAAAKANLTLSSRLLNLSDNYR